MEPQAQLIGPDGGGRGAVRIKVELTLLDPIFHLAARAVDVLVEIFGSALGALERGDDEARIGLALGPLGLGDDPALTTPAAPCLILELPEGARRLAGPSALRLGSCELVLDLGNQAEILL